MRCTVASCCVTVTNPELPANSCRSSCNTSEESAQEFREYKTKLLVQGWVARWWVSTYEGT
jgi:hypothetical protein